MSEFFKDWRRRSGLLTLIVALVFAGAWFKSSFDKTVICCPNGNNVDELSMRGKIGVFCYPANVEIMGLYRESLVLRLPYQSVEESGRPTPARDAVDFSFEVPPPSAMLEDTEVMPVSYQTVASNAEESSSSESWNQSDAKPTQVGKPIGINVDFDKQVVSDTDGNTYAMDSELAKELAEGEDEDEGLATSKWQGFGFYANWTKSRDGGWNASFLVPHGSVAIPLMLLSLVLLFMPSSFRRAKLPALS